MNTRIEYPISMDYVKNWGCWEMIREILQNAIDAGGLEVLYSDGTLMISNDGKMSRDVLLLGNSQKKNGAIGKFGEGMKLAMLVAARQERSMKIYTGKEVWSPSITYSETVDNDVFCVDMFDHDYYKVMVQVRVTKEEWSIAKGKWLKDHPIGIIKDRPPGDIFVGGLYVCTFDDFEHAYNFLPDQIQLNRDRDIPSMFNVQYQATKMLADQSPDKLLKIAMSEKNDVVTYSAPAATLAKSWTHHYGDVVPVGISEQDEIEAPRKRIVPDWLAKAIRSVKGFVFKSKKSPVDRLVEWRDRNWDSLSADQCISLNEIIRDLMPFNADDIPF